MSPTAIQDDRQWHDYPSESIPGGGDWYCNAISLSWQELKKKARFTVLQQRFLTVPDRPTTLHRINRNRTGKDIASMQTTVPIDSISHLLSSTTSIQERHLSQWRYPDTSVSGTALRKIELLRESFTIRNPSFAISIIETTDDLDLILVEASSRLREYFPSEQLVIEPVCDPEEDIADQLAICIVTARKPEDALQRLDRFDADWWINRANQVQGRLMVNLEFI